MGSDSKFTFLFSAFLSHLLKVDKLTCLQTIAASFGGIPKNILTETNFFYHKQSKLKHASKFCKFLTLESLVCLLLLAEAFQQQHLKKFLLWLSWGFRSDRLLLQPLVWSGNTKHYSARNRKIIAFEIFTPLINLSEVD